MRVFSSRPGAVWHIFHTPTWIHYPVCWKLGSLKQFWTPHFGYGGNGIVPTRERVRAWQKKFALDSADTLADHFCWWDLEDGTLQDIFSRDAAEQRPDSSRSHLSLSEKVKKGPLILS